MGRHGSRLLVGQSCVCYKLQLDYRTPLGGHGAVPDRSRDRMLDYSYLW